MRLLTSSVYAFNPYRVCTTHRFQDKVMINDFKPSIYPAPWLHLTFLGKVWPCRARPCPRLPHPFRWRAVHQRKEAISVQLSPSAAAGRSKGREGPTRQASPHVHRCCSSLACKISSRGLSPSLSLPTAVQLVGRVPSVPAAGWEARQIAMSLSFLLSPRELRKSPILPIFP